MLLGQHWITLGELVHASFILINLLPDGLVHIPAILRTHTSKLTSLSSRKHTSDNVS